MGGVGWNTRDVQKKCLALFVGVGFGMLLGPEETPVGCFSWAAPGLDCLTHLDVCVFFVGWWVWWWLWWVGVWWCVECCIVDASI
jgi:hypothetical protein